VKTPTRALRTKKILIITPEMFRKLVSFEFYLLAYVGVFTNISILNPNNKYRKVISSL
jgi:hypothetical protein